MFNLQPNKSSEFKKKIPFNFHIVFKPLQSHKKNSYKIFLIHPFGYLMPFFTSERSSENINVVQSNHTTSAKRSMNATRATTTLCVVTHIHSHTQSKYRNLKKERIRKKKVQSWIIHRRNRSRVSIYRLSESLRKLIKQRINVTESIDTNNFHCILNAIAREVCWKFDCQTKFPHRTVVVLLLLLLQSVRA